MDTDLESDMAWRERRERAACRWTLGSGLALGTWWAFCGLVALKSLSEESWGLAMAPLLSGLYPVLLWWTGTHEDEVLGWMDRMEAFWATLRGRCLDRVLNVVLSAAPAWWVVLASA
jgi:hypothetical protein